MTRGHVSWSAPYTTTCLSGAFAPNRLSCDVRIRRAAHHSRNCRHQSEPSSTLTAFTRGKRADLQQNAGVKLSNNPCTIRVVLVGRADPVYCHICFLHPGTEHMPVQAHETDRDALNPAPPAGRRCWCMCRLAGYPQPPAPPNFASGPVVRAAHAATCWLVATELAISSTSNHAAICCVVNAHLCLVSVSPAKPKSSCKIEQGPNVPDLQ